MCPHCGEIQERGFALCTACGGLNPGRQVNIKAHLVVTITEGEHAREEVMIDLDEDIRRDEVVGTLRAELGNVQRQLRDMQDKPAK